MAGTLHLEPDAMLDTIVRHLHQSNINFRLTSYASPEREPPAAHPIPAHALLVEARLVTVGGRLVLACVRAGDHIDMAALGNELGGTALTALPEDVPEALVGFERTTPPLGKLLGLPLIVDEAVEGCVTLVFRAFDGNNYFEVPYDGFLLLEQPKTASFARVGELEEGRISDRRPEDFRTSV
jgi:prolyl-tRNA editing enzyme YbaK/EbsC (Cys-tRNA(Pro) deacylase)